MYKQKKLDLKPSLDHIDYRDYDADLTDSDAHFGTDTEAPTFTGPPKPPLDMAAYTQPVYAGTTHNPTVFLAILHIAQRNLPGMDFVSALNHIPNIRPADQLPVLIPTASGNLAPAPFLDSRPPYKRPGDDDINVAFLPYFYGERHGIAYWQYIKDFKRGIALGSACVTPCSEDDLRHYGLVDYIAAEDLAGFIKQDGGSVRGVDMMRVVGIEDGNWMQRDVVEDWTDWRATFRTCAVHWESRMRLMRGEHER
ncbi:uncharacterized protein M421DRAFT_51836 [Didymella exigua CBS 183.55]|uniref:Uncharacterized protein n=1 Tax=Didymella exigua CBS 183.55 TaxID=1150837 RepID=A0A6A5S176_9PLEO|nr:uncharacterized protein M421DRAFT_51836 [Didymella exigua CBS 183.55]KAF1933539.1 hypothetical protein M421DRAFT_51836 [Didymella exigua CBS 183.55]